MADDSWICQALEAIDDADLGHDPLSDLSDQEVDRLDRLGLIRVIRRAERIEELGNDEKLDSRYSEVELTQQGESYLNENC